MARQKSKDKPENFIRWFKKWSEERARYPCWFNVRINDRPKENDAISVVIYPQIDRRDSMGVFDDERYAGQGYEVPLCFFKEKLTSKSCELLTTALIAIRNQQGLDFDEGLAFMTQVFLFFVDFCRLQDRKESILFGPKQWELNDHPQGTKIQRHLQNKPLSSLEALLNFWHLRGARLSAGYITSPDGSVGRPSYKSIPPVWLKAEDLKEIHGDDFELPKIPILIDAEIFPFVEKLPEISRSLKVVYDLPYKPEEKSTSSITKFPQIEGLTWEEVKLEFVSNDSLRIKARNITKRYTYAELGFKDNRKGDLPDSKWEILKEGFARFAGELSWETPIDPRWKKNLKSTVKELRKRLKSIMSIDDDPFYPYRKIKAYRTRFKIKDCSY